MYTFVQKSVYSRVITTSRIDFIRRYLGKSEVLTSVKIMPKKVSTGDSLHETKVSSVYIEVIGSGAPGMPSCVILGTNFGSYLINCGEGVIKLASEYKIKFHKTQNAFITYPSWRNIGGLVGVCLSAQDGHSTQFTIHGHSDIGHVFSSINNFIKLRQMKVIVKHCEPSEECINGMNVKCVLLSSSSSSPTKEKLSAPSQNLDNDRSSDTNFEFDSKDEKKLIINKFISKNNKTELQRKRDCMKNAFSYIFSFKETPGKLIIEKCIEFGVPPGPLLGELKNGKDITLQNGVKIRSADVTEPQIPGVSIIAMECPSEDFFDSLLSEPAFLKYQSTEGPATAVIHFSKSDIVKHEKYQEWLSRFPKSTLHLFINDENKRTGSVAIHRLQYKLHLLQPELFPLLDDPHIPSFPRTEDTILQEGHVLVPFKNVILPSSGSNPIYKDKIYLKCESNPHIYGETLCEVNLKPKNPSFDYTRSIVLKRDLFLQEVYENNEEKKKLDESVKYIREQAEKLKTNENVYPKFVFLGTGSSKPSKTRNGSGVLVFSSESDCILLDCAEFTFGQMVNFYGLKKTRQILRNLHAVFISHMHVDHQWGLITILKERKNAFDELSSDERTSKDTEFRKLFLLAPVSMSKWLSLFSQKFEDISDLYNLIPNSSLTLTVHCKNDIPSLRDCKNVYNFSNICTARVFHWTASFGVAITHKSGWKITYSGDTRPCDSLVNIGKNSDVLIHEATFENVYTDEARVKRHSTILEAINVGKKMKAKFTLLTHFSQRYCYLPNIKCLLENENVGIAFDFMEVPYNFLPLLPELLKPLQCALSKYDELNNTATELFLQKKEKLKRAKIDLSDLPDFSKIGAKISKLN